MTRTRTPSHAADAPCPIPLDRYPVVLLGHGGGGRLMQQIIERMFLQAFDNPVLEALHDGAVLEVDGARLAFSTDSFVVSPLFFPGGDIGSLAVHGTVNDLAMCGTPATWCWSTGRSLFTASPSCRCGRGWSSRRRWRATRRHCTIWWPARWRRPASRSTSCATRPVVVSPAP